MSSTGIAYAELAGSLYKKSIDLFAGMSHTYKYEFVCGQSINSIEFQPTSVHQSQTRDDTVPIKQERLKSGGCTIAVGLPNASTWPTNHFQLHGYKNDGKFVYLGSYGNGEGRRVTIHGALCINEDTYIRVQLEMRSTLFRNKWAIAFPGSYLADPFRMLEAWKKNNTLYAKLKESSDGINITFRQLGNSRCTVGFSN